MSRPPLSVDAVTVVKKYKVPANLAADFAERCESLGYSQSETIRTLVERWLRQTAEIVRMKKKGNK